MFQRTRSNVTFWALAALFFAVTEIASAIPEKVAVSGLLVDASDDPIDGFFDMEVSFFFEPATGAGIGSTTTTIDVDEGLFGVAVSVPPELTTLEQAWYRVSIDLDGDGFGPEDLFGEYHEILSVPFALTGKPVDFFETNGGHRISFSGSGLGPFVPDTLVMVPFSTPPGGVRFNRLALRAVFAGVSSYGIYDAGGNLLLSTEGRPPDVVGDPFVFEIQGKLEPSRIYYAAYTSDANRYPQTRINMVPTLPTVGRVVGGGNGGLLPETVDLDQIQTIGDEPTLSFGLYYVDERAPKILREGKGARTAERDLPKEIREMIKALKTGQDGEDSP